ncbi:ciliary neurotrophic factor, partial [Megalops cyprinoides]|uniref:ciliary neurotrophic factor n=1 Tax=Megalops cyprinoides TaxID=118141 RepID=UPI0018641368
MAGAVAGGRPGSVRSRTGKAAALARLLHRDCTRLLELYREREHFPPEFSPEKGRIVPVAPSAPHLSASERVCLLHSALRQCLGLLERVIGWEEEQGADGEGEYQSVRNAVRDRLGHLLQSTKALLVDGEGMAALTPDPNNAEEMDGLGRDGAFGAKLWAYRVLQELIHWTHSTAQTLHALQTDREKERGKMGKKREE